MDKEKINQALKRPILDGSKFDNLIDLPPANNQNLGKGDTFHTVAQMKRWTMQHFKQVSRLAQVLKLGTLEQTC